MAITYYVTAAKVKTLGNIASVDDAKIEAHFLPAQNDVIEIIGQTNYDKYIASEEATDEADKEKITLAEAYFVLAYAFPAINTVTGGTGIKRASGFNDSRQENMSENEMQSRCDEYRRNAVKLLGKYKPVVDNDEDGNPDILITPHLKFAVLSNNN